MFYGNWNSFRLICGNHGDDNSIEMILHEGPHSLFYSCPHYQSIFSKDSKGKSCNNRLNLVDYEYMINHLSEKMYDDAGSIVPIVGYSFKRKGVVFEVIAQEEDKITVKMLNKKAITH